jgi:nitrate reductase gamma subunit
MMDVLRVGVVLSALFALVALTVLVVKTLSFGKRPFYSRDAGSKVSGVIYAFGRGMMPWEKESSRKHLLTYLSGVIYHAGIFAALIYLLCAVFSLSLPWYLLQTLRIALVVGGACGLSLLLKRILSRKLRKLSCPDDYAANIIVTLFVILAAVHAAQLTGWQGPAVAGSPTLSPSRPTAVSSGPAVGLTSFVEGAFYIVSILMFLYVPVGKIRHCFFFFYSRVLLGIFFGRRSALPTR